MAAGLIVLLVAMTCGQHPGSQATPPAREMVRALMPDGSIREVLGWREGPNVRWIEAEQKRMAPMGAIGPDGAVNYGVSQDELKADGLGTVYTDSADTEAKAREIAGDDSLCKPSIPDVLGIKAEIHEIAVYAIAGVLILCSLFFLTILAVWGFIRWLR